MVHHVYLLMSVLQYCTLVYYFNYDYHDERDRIYVVLGNVSSEGAVENSGRSEHHGQRE